MPNILACTDGSLYSPSVYDHAAWAAKKLNASVHVLHMLNPHHEEPVKTDYSGSIGFNARSTLLKELVDLEAANARIAIKRGEAILEDAKERLAPSGLKIKADQKHGKLSDSIQDYEKDADLVIIGKRGNNANFETGHLGSNLERVIRSCKHPVLVASREFSPVERFVIAFDGGSSALKAVDYATHNPLLKGMQCHLLMIGHANAAQKTALSEAKEQLTAAGYSVSAEILPGEPEAVIGEYVASGKADLLVMGAYGHSSIRQFIVGSTTSAMIRMVKVPVLLFR